uniref:Ferritin n=1 Tax=Panagrellus redivivus TaxID=6233 RepID=A0A7E4ZWZ5_PANRE
MSAHFGNAEVALPGAAAYFKNQAYEEREHAEKIIDYINDRGGTVDFGDLAKPTCNCTSLLKAFQSAVALEKSNNKSLLQLHALASENNDPDNSTSANKSSRSRP